jgi:hypothetical protein
LSRRTADDEEVSGGSNSTHPQTIVSDRSRDLKLALTAEQYHLEFLQAAVGGMQPANPNGSPAPIYYNVSDAVPFIQGGTGLIGPLGLLDTAAVRSLAGIYQALRVPAFTQVF